jgi:hypothetical protein
MLAFYELILFVLIVQHKDSDALHTSQVSITLNWQQSMSQQHPVAQHALAKSSSTVVRAFVSEQRVSNELLLSSHTRDLAKWCTSWYRCFCVISSKSPGLPPFQ